MLSRNDSLDEEMGSKFFLDILQGKKPSEESSVDGKSHPAESMPLVMGYNMTRTNYSVTFEARFARVIPPDESYDSTNYPGYAGDRQTTPIDPHDKYFADPRQVY